jgi:hypothetical protein
MDTVRGTTPRQRRRQLPTIPHTLYTRSKEPRRPKEPTQCTKPQSTPHQPAHHLPLPRSPALKTPAGPKHA